MININNLFTEDSPTLTGIFEYDLWIRIILHAVEDIVLIDVLEEESKNGISDKYTDELKYHQQTAYSFLFDDNYYIPFDDYYIKYLCPDCDLYNTVKMSVFSNGYICSCGKKIIEPEEVDYELKEIKKEICFREILNLFNIETVDKFRELLKKRIVKLKVLKRQRREKQRIQRKIKQEKKIKKGDFK